MADGDKKLRQKLRGLIVELAEPIDFAALEVQGLLKKEDGWYRLFNPHKLPSHVTRKIISIKSDAKGSLAKFESEKPYKKMKNKLR